MNERSVKNDIVGLFVGGAVVLFLGAIIMIGAWPSTEVYGSSFLDEPVVSESGSEGGFFFGLLVAGLGQIMLTIAIIATGVRVAMRDRVAVPVH